MDNLLISKKWLDRAKSNLNRGKESDNLDLRGVFIEDLCFDLQQSVEKALKALLIAKGVDFPKTHSISKLLNLLKNNSVQIPEEVMDASILSLYAVMTRYPDEYRAINSEDHKEAVRLAEVVYRWVKNQIYK